MRLLLTKITEMKKVIILIIYCCVGTTATSQALFGIKAGAQNIYWTGNDVIAPFRTYSGYLAGATANFNIHSHLFSLQPEILYSAEGVKFDKGKINMTYINIPVVIQYGHPPGVYAEAGAQLNILASAKKTGTGTGDGDVKKILNL